MKKPHLCSTSSSDPHSTAGVDDSTVIEAEGPAVAAEKFANDDDGDGSAMVIAMGPGDRLTVSVTDTVTVPGIPSTRDE